VDAESLEKAGPELYLGGLQGILVPGGFGERGIEGKVIAARYAREHKVPYFGICLGMQIAVIEFARNVVRSRKVRTARSSIAASPHPVITLDGRSARDRG